MRDKKFLRKLLIASLAAGSLIFTPELYGLPSNAAIVHAEVMEYVGVGESIVSDRETLDIGKQGARLQAIRNAQKQAGVFISSHSVMRDHELESDEVVAFTASVVKISDDIKYEPIQVEQWIKYRATVVVTIDTDDLTTKVNQWLGISSQDRSTLTERGRDLNTTLDRIQTRTVEIETAVAGASSTVDATQIQAEIKELDRDILYAQKISEGNEFLRKGDRASAMRLYQEAIAIYPRDATIAYEKLGDSYLEAKDYTRAIDAYTKVIQMDPNYSVPYFKRGKIYLGLEDYIEAARDFRKTIELAPESSKAEFYFESINYYYSLNKAIMLAPNNVDYINRRAEVYIGLGNYESAAKDLEKSIQLQPKLESKVMQVSRYETLSDCYEKLGDMAKAIELYKRALEDKEIIGYKVNFYERLIKYYEKLGDKKKIIEICNTASQDKHIDKYYRTIFKKKIKELESSN